MINGKKNERCKRTSVHLPFLLPQLSVYGTYSITALALSQNSTLPTGSGNNKKNIRQYFTSEQM